MKHEKIAGLVFDSTIYPRHDVDRNTITKLREAHLAGEKLPPLVVCRDTKKIIDGVHRWKMLVAEHGADAKSEVQWEQFQDDSARLLRSIELNARHGCKLTSYDTAHCVVLAERLRIPRDALAKSLGVRPSSVESSVKDRFAGAIGVKGGYAPLKRTIRHMAGRKLTARQVQANDRLQGWPASFHADQLCELIEADLLNREDEKSMAALQKLHGLLDGLFATA